jgi:hypothetical protein
MEVKSLDFKAKNFGFKAKRFDLKAKSLDFEPKSFENDLFRQFVAKMTLGKILAF